MPRAPYVTVLLAILTYVPLAGAAPATDVTYSLAGAATTIVCPPGECTSGISTTGSLATSGGPPGAPTSGDFRLDLSTVVQPADPCRIRRVSGTLTVNWSDGTITIVSLDGHFHDSKPLLYLSGRVGAGSTGTVYLPTDPCKGLIDGAPTDPCVVATNAVTGSIVFPR